MLSLVLSNAKNINFCYDENYIPHMLGINTYFLKNYCHGTKAYEILKDFLENSYSIFSKLMKDGGIDESKFFSPFIEQKIKVFKNNISFRFFDVQFIAEIDREKTYNRGDEEEQLINADCLLVQKLESAEFEYGILAFSKNERGYYSIISSMGADDLEYFEKYFYKQNLTLPYYLTIDTWDNTKPAKKFWLPMENLYKVYANAKPFKQKYEMSFCLDKYYEYLYNELSKQRSQNEELNDFLKIFIQNMVGESMVTKPELHVNMELNNLLGMLIDAYNNTLYVRTPLSIDDLEQKQSLEEKDQKIEDLEQKVATLEQKQKQKELELEEITRKYEEMRATYETWQATLTSIKSMINDTPKLELEKN